MQSFGASMCITAFPMLAKIIHFKGLAGTTMGTVAFGAGAIVAVVGKGVACWLAALATGLPNREAMGICTLMNSRGLMELIVINIGLQRGILSEELFAILVIMAVRRMGLAIVWHEACADTLTALSRFSS